MAEVAMELFEKEPYLADELAKLAEDRLYRAEKSSFYSSWIAFGLRVAGHPNPEVRRRLIYFACGSLSPTELKLKILAEMMSGSAGLDVIAAAFEMIVERGNELPDTVRLEYLRPMVLHHGQDVPKALHEWVKNEASRFELLKRFDTVDKDRAQLNHVLGLLVQALSETHPLVSEDLQRRLVTAAGWIEVFSGGEVS